MNKRDKNKRLKGFGIPVELCVRYERMAGVKTDDEERDIMIFSFGSRCVHTNRRK